VGVPSLGTDMFGIVYYAGAKRSRKTGLVADEEKSERLTIFKKDRPKEIKNASICFYGQKAGNLLCFLKKERFIDLLGSFQEMSKSDKSVPFRVYNFGGNPMMIKLVEGGVDAVIELKGQKLHDCVPGAYIAAKAGAFWGDLEGKQIDNEYLRPLLSDVENVRLPYILASSKALYDDILKYI
jgi:fructose-1,6-bisphosphatase/inositol monophosphatase family enzyme